MTHATIVIKVQLKWSICGRKKKIHKLHDQLSSDNNGNSADYKLITISLGGGGLTNYMKKN